MSYDIEKLERRHARSKEEKRKLASLLPVRGSAGNAQVPPPYRDLVSSINLEKKRVARDMKQIMAVGLLVVALAFPGAAFGHAISIGFENAGAGSVNIWLGTYQHGGHHLEGSLNLVGVFGNPFPSTTVAFSILTPNGVAFKPAGLIDGVTNFYADWDGNIPNNLPLVGSEAPFNAGCPACGPVEHWQGVNFSGLLAGFYQFTYVPIAFPTAEWDLLSTNMNGIFDLSGVIDPGPGPAPHRALGYSSGRASWGCSATPGGSAAPDPRPRARGAIS